MKTTTTQNRTEVKCSQSLTSSH